MKAACTTNIIAKFCKSINGVQVSQLIPMAGVELEWWVLHMHTSDQLIGCKNARWDGSCPRRCAGQGPHRSSLLCCTKVILQGHQFRNSPVSYMCNLYFSRPCIFTSQKIGGHQYNSNLHTVVNYCMRWFSSSWLSTGVGGQWDYTVSFRVLEDIVEVWENVHIDDACSVHALLHVI